jgi:hypothetical protein
MESGGLFIIHASAFQNVLSGLSAELEFKRGANWLQKHSIEASVLKRHDFRISAYG